MSRRAYRHLYGPVDSRRLGSSLGVDIIPPKVCTYDCIYCQLGRTTEKTMKRQEYVDIDEVLKEVELKLTEKSKPAYISISGSGEPTLNSGIGTLVRGIKNITDIPVTVITNGSLLWMDDVKDDLAGADVVLPSLDAGDDARFRFVNRPHPGIAFEKMVDGISRFTREFAGEVWLEVFLSGGVTDSPPEIEKIAGLAEVISPERIQLNTVYRPPSERFALAVPPGEMLGIKAAFSGNVQIISPSDRGDVPGREIREAAEKDILGMISRRPCTAEDVAGGLGIHRNEAIKHLKSLSESGKAGLTVTGNRTYYYSK